MAAFGGSSKARASSSMPLAHASGYKNSGESSDCELRLRFVVWPLPIRFADVHTRAIMKVCSLCLALVGLFAAVVYSQPGRDARDGGRPGPPPRHPAFQLFDADDDGGRPEVYSSRCAGFRFRHRNTHVPQQREIVSKKGLWYRGETYRGRLMHALAAWITPDAPIAASPRAGEP